MSAHDATLGSFLLRTAHDVDRQETLPGLSLYRSNRYYVAQQGRYYLTDNGPRDGDSRDGAFQLTVSTRGWRDGAHRLAFFASCRPAPGPFVAARRDLTVTVKSGQVTIADHGDMPLEGPPSLDLFSITPSAVTAGQGVQLTCQVASSRVTRLELYQRFYIARQETLPGFRYDAEQKTGALPLPALSDLDNGALDQDPAAARITLQLDTSRWRPGSYHFQLDVVGGSGKKLAWRNFAITVRDPRDHLTTTVSASRRLGPGTHFGRFVKLRDGTLLCNDQYSTDSGHSWQGSNGGFGVGAMQLPDGRVLGFDYRCLPLTTGSGVVIPGQYTLLRSLSDDNARTFEKSTARVHVPEAVGAQGHSPHLGPLFMRSLVPRADGSLLGLFAGWFKSDTALCPYGRGRPYSRTYVCESSDEGRHWQYLTTLGYEQIGSEGYNEGAMQRLPNGHLLAVIRTGNEKDKGCQHNPIMWTASRDDGRTWSPPRETGLEGAYPSLIVLSDGMLALSYGRPGAMLAFSADHGRTWTDRTVVDTTPDSGYTDIVEIAPGELLFGFGTRGFLDVLTGSRSDQLRLANVQYR